MRIAVVSNTVWYLVNFRLNLMQRLMAAGHEVVAVAPQGDDEKRLREAGVPFAAWPLNGGSTSPLREAGSVVTLRRLLKAHGTQLVLSYTPKGNLYAALAMVALGVPLVANVSGLGRVFIQRSWVTPVVRALYRLTLRRAAHVFFQNADDRTFFVREGLVPEARTELLPGSGVDLTRFAPVARPARPLDAPTFLLMGRLMWDKGLGEFVAAARAVKALHPQARFVLLGFLSVSNPSAIGPAQVQAWVDEGLLEYRPPAEDVRPHLADADCVVLPSYREGVPRTLLEAAAMARPVITTDAPGCRDAVQHEVTGLMCRPRDADDLAQQMLRFIALPEAARESMGRAGRAFVEERFDDALVLQRYMAVVERLS